MVTPGEQVDRVALETNRLAKAPRHDERFKQCLVSRRQ
jgi:hypothetical protein